MGKKEKIRKDCTIRIRTLLEVTENPKGTFTNKERLYLINIDKFYSKTSTCFPCNKKGKKDLLNFIKNELYLR